MGFRILMGALLLCFAWCVFGMLCLSLSTKDCDKLCDPDPGWKVNYGLTPWKVQCVCVRDDTEVKIYTRIID